MWHPPRPPIQLGVEALDQQRLLGRLPVEVIPLVLPVRSDSVRLTLPVRVYETDAHEVRVRDGMRIRHSQGVLQNLLDRPPNVDDLVAGREQPVRVFR